ncbi:MAG: metallophosphoesterase family protein [Marinilabiliales bacterium]|nr:metallophosphoesterase family protein [Marinilabiliales bacterium]
MKKAIFILLLALCSLCQPLFAKKLPSLHFHADGSFKILQFTDTHIHIASGSNLYSLELIKDLVALERPDLVVLTGDIVTEDPPTEGYKKLVAILQQTSTPWMVVFGNHESERKFSRTQLAQLVENLPGCLNSDVGGICGNSNFVFPIQTNNGKIGALIYGFDSNAYSTLKPVVDGYGWIGFNQIEWYRKVSEQYKRENGGQPLPALAFFHIPLPEYRQATEAKDARLIGVKNEEECCPEINSGLFTAILECGDIMGTFVGHDHINDYITSWHGIALAYGRVSKVMKSPEDPLAGGRILVLHEGKREFDTWIRDKNGDKVLSTSFPAMLQKK